MLSGFKVVTLTTGSPTVSVTKNGVALNKSAVIKLEKAPYVLLLIDEVGKRIAVQKCEKDDEGATSFYTGQKSFTVRWNNAELLRQIEKMMNWDLTKNGYKTSGDLFEEDMALIFDLNSIEKIEG